MQKYYQLIQYNVQGDGSNTKPSNNRMSNDGMSFENQQDELSSSASSLSKSSLVSSNLHLQLHLQMEGGNYAAGGDGDGDQRWQQQQRQSGDHTRHHEGDNKGSTTGSSGGHILNGGSARNTANHHHHHPSLENLHQHCSGVGGVKGMCNGPVIEESNTVNDELEMMKKQIPLQPLQQHQHQHQKTTTYADALKAGIHEDSMNYLAVHSPSRSDTANATATSADANLHLPCQPYPTEVIKRRRQQQHLIQNSATDVPDENDAACKSDQQLPPNCNTTVSTRATTTTTTTTEPATLNMAQNNTPSSCRKQKPLHGSQSIEQQHPQQEQYPMDDLNCDTDQNPEGRDHEGHDSGIQRQPFRIQQQQQHRSTMLLQSWSTCSPAARGHSLERIAYILGKGSLVMINFSQRNLGHADAHLIHSAILSNPQLSVLKLGYNNLGNIGANLIASAIQNGGGGISGNNSDGFGGNNDVDTYFANSSNGEDDSKSGKDSMTMMIDEKKGDEGDYHSQHHHHPSLSILDLGFNNISDEGCTSLAVQAVSHNPTLSTLYLSGNAVSETGALALANVLADGCGLTSLHLTANRIGPSGVRGLMRSMAEFDVMVQMARQDRENMIALQGEGGKDLIEERRRRGRRRSMNMENKELIKGAEERAEKKNMAMIVDEEQNRFRNANEEESGISELNKFDDDDDDNDNNNNAECDNNSVVEPPVDFSRLRGFRCMKELYLGGTHMGSIGCLSVSNMLLTNSTLRVICLSDNGLNDQDLSLFSQSLSRNRELPLEILRLSFNRVTCVGVETLMNAIWGSKTLREIKLDNNQIRDRGAQLAAVVMTSVDLEVIDLGFNRLTIVGIKALMKSLAENRSLLTLTLSGNVLDTNASKAVSYALAYNKTIRKLYVDHCSLTYAAQRHIAAGIVSNSNLALRVMSGFPLGAISVTLGLPGAMETWSNEQVLKFIRIMWDRYRHQEEASLVPRNASTQSMSTAGIGSETSDPDKPTAETVEPKSGPSDPATVVAAAKSAFDALGDAGGALLLTEESQRSISDSSPMVSSDAVMLEKTSSGTLRVPSLDDLVVETGSYQKEDCNTNNVGLEVSTTHNSTESLCIANNEIDRSTQKRNMEWLRLHFRPLNEMTQLPYVHADLLQLHGYFYSPAHVDEEDSAIVPDDPPHRGVGLKHLGSGSASMKNPSELHCMPLKQLSALQRKISYRGLHDVMMGQSSHDSNHSSSPDISSASETSCKRRPVTDQSMAQPATKRARSGKPRIDYFPRLKAKIEQFLSSSKQSKALVLLRQLKFVETTMFHNGSPYYDQSSSTTTAFSSNTFSDTTAVAMDAEIILLDML